MKSEERRVQWADPLDVSPTF